MLWPSSKRYLPKHSISKHNVSGHKTTDSKVSGASERQAQFRKDHQTRSPSKAVWGSTISISSSKWTDLRARKTLLGPGFLASPIRPWVWRATVATEIFFLPGNKPASESTAKLTHWTKRLGYTWATLVQALRCSLLQPTNRRCLWSLVQKECCPFKCRSVKKRVRFRQGHPQTQ